MENKEEVSTALEEFGRLQNSAISTVLEQYLTRIAATGITLFPWTKVKPLLLHKLDLVLKEFHERAPVDNPTPCPNVDDVKFDEMHKRLLSSLEQFSGTPFTIQRLCELLTCPTKHYKKVDKFMRGIEKNLGVVTTVDSFGNRIVSESKLLVNGLDSSIDQTTIERNAGNTSFVADQSAGNSPYIPTPPVNSPANVSGGGSGSWFSSLTSVVESPSSYPNWRASDATAHTTGDGLSADGSWPVLVFEADDDSPPPTKRRFTGRQSQRPADRGDAESTPPPVTVVAPLLGQLLSSSSYDSGSGGGSTGDGPTDGTSETGSAETESGCAKLEASNENAENEKPSSEKEASGGKASDTEPIAVSLSNELTASQSPSGTTSSTMSAARDDDDILPSGTDAAVDSIKLDSSLSDHRPSSPVAVVNKVVTVSAVNPATDNLSTASPEAEVLSDTVSDASVCDGERAAIANVAVDTKNATSETSDDIPSDAAASESCSIPTTATVEKIDTHNATSSDVDIQKVDSDVDSDSIELEIEPESGTDSRRSDHGAAPAAVAGHEMLTVAETPMETD